MNTYHLYYWAGPDRMKREFREIHSPSKEMAKKDAIEILRAAGAELKTASMFHVHHIAL